MHLQFAASSGSSSGGGIISLALLVIQIVATWFCFQKAGESGWKAIIPFYNSYIFTKVAGKNGWLFLLLLIPIVDIFFYFWIAHNFGKRFGKGGVFSFFLIGLFPFVGLSVIAFSPTKYIGPKHN